MDKKNIDVCVIDRPDYWIEGLKGFNLFVVDKRTDALTAKIAWFNCTDHLKNKVNIINKLATYLMEYKSHNRFIDVDGKEYWDYKIAIEAKYYYSDEDLKNLKTSITILDCSSDDYEMMVDKLKNKAQVESLRAKYERISLTMHDTNRIFSLLSDTHKLDDTKEYLIISRYGLKSLNRLSKSNVEAINKSDGTIYSYKAKTFVRTWYTSIEDFILRNTIALDLQDPRVQELTTKIELDYLWDNCRWKNINFISIARISLDELCNNCGEVRACIEQWLISAEYPHPSY